MPGRLDVPDVLKPEAQRRPGLLLSNSLTHLWQVGLDLLFPPRCVGCDRVDSAWCARCADQLTQISITPDKRLLQDHFMIASTGLHDGILQNAVQALKYYNLPALRVPLGQRLTDRLNLEQWPIEVIIPVPMHATRLAQRGYNQAQLLAQYLATSTALPCLPDALHRVRETISQVGLNREERLENMKDVFEGDSALLTGKNILIVDDVLTTGSTLNGCAQAAFKAGAKEVFGLTVTAASAF